MTTASIDIWLDELISAAEEVATSALGFEVSTLVNKDKPSNEDLRGSYLAMVGDEQTVQLGIAVKPEDSIPLARALMCMEPEDGDLSDEEIIDALGEMVNILAGGLKTRMDGRAPPMVIGMPLVMQGHVEVPNRASIARALVDWGGIEAQLLVYVQSKNGTH